MGARRRCCCDCDCVLDASVASWIQDAGTWDAARATTDSDARLRSSTSASPWHAVSIRVQHSVASEWVQVGFTNDASYDDRVYVRARVVSATKTLELEWRQTIAGVDETIASQSFTITSAVSSLNATFWLIYDADYGTITGRIFWESWRNVRQSHSATAKYAYAGSETITGTTTVDDGKTQRCFANTNDFLFLDSYTRYAPHEWSLDLSGVKAGNPAFGYTWWNDLNDIHVVPSYPPSRAPHRWQLSDAYDGTPVTWQVRAFYFPSAPTLILAGCVSDQTMNPLYNHKPCLVIVAFFGVDTSFFNWAAIVQSDWDSDTYYYGDEHVMTPTLFPAVCQFDWRTISQHRLTWICGANDGIDFTQSNLYISAVP